jgi:hypothetical protein
MAVVSMMRFQGDPEELAAKIDEHVDPVSRRLAPQHGGLANLVARTDDGVLVINLWRDEEGRHAMAQEPEIQQAVGAAGLPQPNFDGYEVLHYTIRPEALESSREA